MTLKAECRSRNKDVGRNLYSSENMANQVDKPKLAPVIHERPKMPARTWSALRTHIIAERKRKQEEEGKLEEEERRKKEREYKKRQEANNLEETKEQISYLEEKLSNLKEEKHQLFLTLKKVLNEDDVRRRKESNEMGAGYAQHPVFPMSGHVAPNGNRFMQPARQQGGYMKPNLPNLQGLPPVPPAQPIKRQRTPSPGPASTSQAQAFYQLASSQARVPSSMFSAAPSPVYSMPGGFQQGPGRDLLREAVSQGLGPGARELMQGLGARERELLASMGGGRDIIGQALLSGVPAGAPKEEDAYARYLASFQQQLDQGKPGLAELERARLAVSLSQPQPLARIQAGYYTPSEQGERVSTASRLRMETGSSNDR